MVTTRVQGTAGRTTRCSQADHHRTPGEWRTRLLERMATVRGFVPLLCRVIEFGATAEAAPVLYAVNGCRSSSTPGRAARSARRLLDARRIEVEVVPSGWWQRLAFPKDRPPETVDKAAYVFCVLEQFHQRLKRRDIFASVSERWGDPRSRLLDGEAIVGVAVRHAGTPLGL